MKRYEGPCLYGVQDDYANPRCTYGDLHLCSDYAIVPNAFKETWVDDYKPHYHTYYFSTMQKAAEWLDKLDEEHHKI